MRELSLPSEAGEQIFILVCKFYKPATRLLRLAGIDIGMKVLDFSSICILYLSDTSSWGKTERSKGFEILV
jgi:hypothetical protein